MVCRGLLQSLTTRWRSPLGRRSWLVLAFVSCSSLVAPPVVPLAATPHADVTVRDVTVLQYRGSELRMRATAPIVELNRTTSDFTAWDAGVWLARTRVEILAQEVVGNGNAQVATGQKGVRFIGNDGTIGTTERATYDRALGAEGGAVSDAGIFVRNARFTQEASGFTADLAEQRVVFEQAVTKTTP